MRYVDSNRHSSIKKCKMAAFKTFLLAFLTCSALVQTEASHLGHRNEKSIVDGFQKLVEQYKLIIEEAIEQYMHILKEIVGAVSGNIQDELLKAFEEISNIANAIIKEIEELKQAADKDAETIILCIKEFLPAIRALVQETQEAQTACVQGSIEKIEAIQERLLADLAEIRQEVAVTIGEIVGCKDIGCLKAGGAKLIEQVKVVRENVREAVQEAVQVIQESSPAAISCVVAASDNFNVEIKDIHERVKVCVAASS